MLFEMTKRGNDDGQYPKPGRPDSPRDYPILGVVPGVRIALMLLGIVAVARSVTATIVSMVFFGWLLVFASGIEIAQAVMVGHWVGFFHHFWPQCCLGL